MEHISLEKPPVVREMLIKKIIFSGIWLMIGLALMFYSVSTCIRFRAIEDHAVTLESVVSKVVPGKDVDGYDEYGVYVEYEYNGKTYTKKHLTSTKKEWMDKVGTPIMITINPEKPTEELEDLQDPIFFSMFFGIPILALGVRNCIKLKHRLSWVEMYGLRESAIRADLHEALKMEKMSVWPIVTGIGYIVSGIYIIDIESAGLGGILLGLMLLVLYFILRIPYAKIKKMPKTDPYQVIRKTVLDKKIEKDSDNDNEYFLLLGDESGSNWVRHKKWDYEALDVGVEVTYIIQSIIKLRYWYDKQNRSYWQY